MEDIQNLYLVPLFHRQPFQGDELDVIRCLEHTTCGMPYAGVTKTLLYLICGWIAQDLHEVFLLRILSLARSAIARLAPEGVPLLEMPAK